MSLSKEMFVFFFFFLSMQLHAKVEPVNTESHIKTYYSDCKKQFPDKYIQDVQNNIMDLVHRLPGIDQLIPVVGPISTMSSTTSFARVKALHRQLEELTLHNTSVTVDKIRLASLYKLAIPFIIAMQELLLDEINEIDDLLTFWRYADEHHWDYFLKRNPIAWLQGTQRKSVKDRIKQLKKLKQLYSFHLGRLVIQVSSFNLEEDTQWQYGWLRDLYNTFINSVPNQKLLEPDSNFEAVSALFGKAISVIEKFEQHAIKVRKAHEKPTSLERGWIYGMLGAGAIVGTSVAAVKHSDNVITGAQKVGGLAKDFGNGMADALWGSDQKRRDTLEHHEAEVMKSYETMLLRLLPYYTQDDDTRIGIIDTLIKTKLEDDQYASNFAAEKEIIDSKENNNQGTDKNPDLRLLMDKIRGDKAYKIEQLAQLNDLQKNSENEIRATLYCAMYGGNELPQPKKMFAKIR